MDPLLGDFDSKGDDCGDSPKTIENMETNANAWSCAGTKTGETCNRVMCKPGYKLHGQWTCKDGGYDANSPPTCIKVGAAVQKREGLLSKLQFEIPANADAVRWKAAIKTATQKSVHKKLVETMKWNHIVIRHAVFWLFSRNMQFAHF